MNHEHRDLLETLKQACKGLDTKALIKKLSNDFGDKLVLASSLGVEDQLLTHLCLTANPKARIFVLDTGRLHQETYNVMAKTMARYNMRYEVCFPDKDQVEKMVQEKGPNLFYDSVDNRKRCCHVRKVQPLQKKLNTCNAWITGLRKEQSVTRTDIELIEWDQVHEIIKINPLANWTEAQVWEAIKTHDIPTNALHQKGFPSIGCAPCTRAIKDGEDPRAGRWWWESPENKECGLHVVDGKLVPQKEQERKEKEEREEDN